MRPAQFPPDPTTASSTNPAANKRRRIEAANATLRKPFRSPLVSRRQQQPTPGHGTETGGEGSPTVNRTSHALTPARSGGGRPPLLPADGGKGARQVPAAQGSGVKRRRVGPTTTTATTTGPGGAGPAATAVLTTPGNGHGEGDGGGDGLLARLHAAQKGLAADLRAAEGRLEIVRQARGIEEVMGAAGSGGGDGGDNEDGREEGKGEGKAEGKAEEKEGVNFGELVGRWKGASRLAAEELFELIRARVEGMGGARAWRESRRRQREGFHSDGEDEDGRKKGGGDEKDESEREKGEEEDHVGEEKEEEIEELEFTMLMMLKSLNIDPDVLGYDAVEERWRD